MLERGSPASPLRSRLSEQAAKAQTTSSATGAPSIPSTQRVEDPGSLTDLESYHIDEQYRPRRKQQREQNGIRMILRDSALADREVLFHPEHAFDLLAASV
jgi:hypothetical protein